MRNISSVSIQMKNLFPFSDACVHYFSAVFGCARHTSDSDHKLTGVVIPRCVLSIDGNLGATNQEGVPRVVAIVGVGDRVIVSDGNVAEGHGGVVSATVLLYRDV